MKKLSELLHIFLCEKPHEVDMKAITTGEDRSEDLCYFYLESSLEDCWACADHIEWLGFAVRLCSIEKQAPEKILQRLQVIKEGATKVNEAVNGNQVLREAAFSMIL